MEHANRAEAQRCIEIAKDALRAGETAKSIKLLNKAMKMDSSNDTQSFCNKLLASIERNSREDTPSSSTADDQRHNDYNNHYDDADLRRRFRESKSTPQFNGSNSSRASSKSQNAARNRSRSKSIPKASSSGQLGVDYTKEEVELVARIRRCHDYYEILGISKSASDSDMKKAYRKLALKLHPDKCSAPGATEAFKAIGNAYAVLSDTSKRSRYDMYGAEESSTATSRRRGHNYGHQYYENDYSRGFESDFTPEEIFNMFFGGGYPNGQMYRRGNRYYYQHTANAGADHQHAQNEHQGSGFGMALQLLPILFLLILSLASQLFIGDPAFQMNRSGKYAYERTTHELKVPYFVKSDFMKNYGSYLRRIEQQVEDEYISQLRVNCYRERSQKESMAWRARTYGDQALWERAQNLPTPNCDRLQSVYS